MHTRSYELIVLIESAKGIKSSRTRRKRLLIACEIDSIARKFKTKIERNTEDPVFNEFKAFSIEREEFDLLAVRVSVWAHLVRVVVGGRWVSRVACGVSLHAGHGADAQRRLLRERCG